MLNYDGKLCECNCLEHAGCSGVVLNPLETIPLHIQRMEATELNGEKTMFIRSVLRDGLSVTYRTAVLIRHTSGVCEES